MHSTLFSAKRQEYLVSWKESGLERNPDMGRRDKKRVTGNWVRCDQWYVYLFNGNAGARLRHYGK